MKISKKDIQLLVALAGILIAVAAYFFVYQNFNEKAESLEAENMELASEVARLEALDAKRDTYIAHTSEMKGEITEFENRFPADILPEDSIMTVKIMEDNTNTTVASISFGGASEVVYAQGGAGENAEQAAAEQQATPEQAAEQQNADSATDAEGVQGGVIVATQYADTKMYEYPLGISIQCTYEDFKGLVKYIYSQQNRMSVEGVNIGYDATNNQLSGSMTLNTYYLLGTEKVYTPVNIPSTQLGVDTIFGNID